jgi:hypothetical protein
MFRHQKTDGRPGRPIPARIDSPSGSTIEAVEGK